MDFPQDRRIVWQNLEQTGGAPAPTPAAKCCSDVPDSELPLDPLVVALRTMRRGAAHCVATFPRRRGQELRLSWVDFRGKRRLDLRLWIECEDGDWIATRQGVTVPVEDFDAFVNAVLELDNGLAAAGELERS